MKSIATLTMNPTIDVAYEVDRMIHTHKMRTVSEHYCPGGGGINVARVFVRLGGNARCIYLAGGATGDALDGLVDLHQLVHTRVWIAGHTRIATSALEHQTAKEYRFTPQGPTVSEAEWRNCLDLGGVDKFEPVSGCGDMDHAEEAVGQLVVSGGDRSVDLEVAKHPLDTVALLVERPVMLDFHAAI